MALERELRGDKGHLGNLLKMGTDGKVPLTDRYYPNDSQSFKYESLRMINSRSNSQTKNPNYNNYIKRINSQLNT